MSLLTETHNHLAEQHLETSMQPQTIHLDQSLPLPLVVTQPHRTRSTRLQGGPPQQKQQIQCAEDQTGHAMRIPMCKGIAIHDWCVGLGQDEGKQGREESGSVHSHRYAKDQFLVKSKLSGMSYKEIKAKGCFREAESTLRGRFRTLTKPKEHRVRKPSWHDQDVRSNRPWSKYGRGLTR